MTGPATCCAPTTARPDPRSALQPEGVDGPSQVVDTTAWDRTLWTDSGWAGRELVGSVVYELHVGTFTPAGTLDGVIERLPYLAELGVDMVELMPLAGFPGRAGWGYDGVDLWAVHEAYGGPQALARLVDAAHAHGLGVCLDVVYNHLGPAGNHLGAFGPYFTDAHRTPWGQAVNYDQAGSDQVRAFVIDSALRWLRDFHVDALRLDAIHAIHDDSPPATCWPRWPTPSTPWAPSWGGPWGWWPSPTSTTSASSPPPTPPPRPLCRAWGWTPSGPTTSTTPCTCA